MTDKNTNSNQKFKEWDDILDDKIQDQLTDEKTDNPNSMYEPSKGVIQTSKTWSFIGIIGFTLFFIFVIIPLFTGGGNKTLTSGTGYKVVGSVDIVGDGAYIDATLKVSQSGAYQVNVSIYSSSGQFLGSNNKIFYLSAGDEASVYFYIPNILGGASPSKYTVSVSKP